MKKLITTLCIIFAAISSFACTNLIVTKTVTADGSVIITYAADSHTRYGTLVHLPAGKHKLGEMIKIYEWGKDRYLGEIPQVPYTFNVIGNMNSHQVAIGETTWGGRKEFRDPDGILDYGSLIYITLQRAASAREAIKTYTDLANKYGYASSGESLTFSDKNEAWILEIISKKPKMLDGKNVNKGVVWVARRIPDGMISAHANCARITKFPKNDPENCMYAKDVISHARDCGIYSGNDEDFSFADTYAPLDFLALRACEARVWSFFNKYSSEDMSKYLDFAMGDKSKARMPLFVKAKKKISVKEVADMMRDHYEGTPMDMTKDLGAGGNECPYRWRPLTYKVDGKEYFNERAIATQQTGFWFVAQSRNFLPDEVGGVFWFAVDDAATSPLTPVYTCSKKISNHYALGNGSMVKYSPTSMFWLQNRIAQFAYLRYNQIGKEVRENLDRHEEKMIALVKEMDKKMLSTKRYQRRVRLLTKFSVNQADRLFEKWEHFSNYLLVKYIDGNTKVQNEDGSFKTNKDSKRIPVSPMHDGYTKKYLKAIQKDTGDKLLMK